MPVYQYRALSRDGKKFKGIVESENQKLARQKLKKQGLLVTEIEEQSGKSVSQESPSGLSSISFGAKSVGLKDLSIVTRQLASLIKANIPLAEALNALVEQTEHVTLKVVLSKVRQDVNEGSSLAKALKLHPKVFDHLFINMVESGESSGTLGMVLLRLAELKEAQMRLRNKVMSAMTYPVLMMVVAVIILITIFTFVLPQLGGIFKSQKKEMPFITKLLMDISGFMVDYWYLMLAAAFGFTIFFKSYIKSKKGKRNWDAFQLKAPIFGELFRMIAVTRFSTTMSTLLGSGVPILSCLSISKNIVGNEIIAEAIENAKENITEGQSIAEPLKRSGQFPPMVIHMISIGEKTGELPEMLNNVSHTFEEQVDSRISSLTSLLEPIMIVGMGLVVGVIVIAVFVPLLDLSAIK